MQEEKAPICCTLPTPPLTLLGVPFLGVFPLTGWFFPTLGPFLFLFFLLSFFNFLAMSANGISMSIANRRWSLLNTMLEGAAPY